MEILSSLADGFGIALSNSSGIVYEANLLPGDFIARAGSFGRYKWRDRAAKTGQGVRNGLYQVRLSATDVATSRASTAGSRS